VRERPRVHELAKELNIESRQVLARATALGIQVKSASSGLSLEEVKQLRANLHPVPVAGPALDTEDPRVRSAFDAQYEKYETSRWRPALADLVRTLNQMLDEEAPKNDRLRYRIEEGRIKNRNRVWLKALSKGKQGPALASLQDSFDRVRDVVATRITTNTLTDAYAVLEWLRDNCDKDDPE